MTGSEKREYIHCLADRMGEELLLADGFDDAIMGLGWQFSKVAVVYDREVCLKVLRDRDGMTEDEAEEFFDFNVLGAYVGEHTPIFVERLG